MGGHGSTSENSRISYSRVIRRLRLRIFPQEGNGRLITDSSETAEKLAVPNKEYVMHSNTVEPLNVDMLWDPAFCPL